MQASGGQCQKLKLQNWRKIRGDRLIQVAAMTIAGLRDSRLRLTAPVLRSHGQCVKTGPK